MSDGDDLFQRLVHEATLACGGDRDCVEQYVAEKLAAMSEDDRNKTIEDRDRVLGFRAPDQTPWKN